MRLFQGLVRLVASLLAVVLVAVLVGTGLLAWASEVVPRPAAHPATAPHHEPGRLLIRLRDEGPHAVRACAEARHRRGRPFATVTADGSDSLDRLNARLGVRSIRAAFRRSDARSLAEQRGDHRRRLARGGPFPPGAPDLAHVYRLELARDADVERAAALYRADPHVVWAQPDYRVDLDELPDDPFLVSSDSWGQGYRDLWGLERMRAVEAWEQWACPQQSCFRGREIDAQMRRGLELSYGATGRSAHPHPRSWREPLRQVASICRQQRDPMPTGQKPFGDMSGAHAPDPLQTEGGLPEAGRACE